MCTPLHIPHRRSDPAPSGSPAPLVTAGGGRGAAVTQEGLRLQLTGSYQSKLKLKTSSVTLRHPLLRA